MKEISLHNIRDQRQSSQKKNEGGRRQILMLSKQIAKKKLHNSIDQQIKTSIKFDIKVLSRDISEVAAMHNMTNLEIQEILDSTTQDKQNKDSFQQHIAPSEFLCSLKLIVDQELEQDSKNVYSIPFHCLIEASPDVKIMTTQMIKKLETLNDQDIVHIDKTEQYQIDFQNRPSDHDLKQIKHMHEMCQQKVTQILAKYKLQEQQSIKSTDVKERSMVSPQNFAIKETIKCMEIKEQLIPINNRIVLHPHSTQVKSNNASTTFISRGVSHINFQKFEYAKPYVE